MTTKNVKSSAGPKAEGVRNSAGTTAEDMNKTEAFVSKHRYVLLIVIVAIIVIVVGLFLYRNYVAVPRETKASTAIAASQELFANEDYEQAAEGFKKVISDFGGTKAANLANLYLGLCYANQEKWTEAAKQLEKYSTKDDAMVSPAAMAALGNAYANIASGGGDANIASGDGGGANGGYMNKAVAALKKAAQMADKQAIDGVNYSISATFLLQAGTLLESQGKDAEALALYKEIKEKYVNAQQVQSKEVDKYIERLQEK